MPAGQLRTKLHIVRRTATTKSTIGQPSASATDERVRYGRVTGGPGSEVHDSDREKGIQSVKIRLRYEPNLVRGSDHIENRNHSPYTVYDVEGVDNVLDRGRWLECTCKVRK